MPTGKNGIRFVFDDFVHIAVSYSTAELKSGKTIAAGAASIYADGDFATDSQIGISPRGPAAELAAALSAINLFPRERKICVYSQSSYLIDAFRKGWIEKWKLNNWKKDSVTTIRNADIWKELYRANRERSITWLKADKKLVAETKAAAHAKALDRKKSIENSSR
ncbi:hypothetical protein FMS18_17080 [Desulfovibrio sp. JC022]|nr:hypothetical protein [Desulfovibrio sp. JC022]